MRNRSVKRWSDRLQLRLILILYLFVLSGILTYIRVKPAPGFERGERWLIEWGWNTPLLDDMPRYANQLQTLPFDGAIFDVRNPALPQVNTGLAWTLFTNRTAIDPALLNQVAASFANFEWGNYKHNFLRMNVTPGEVDWFAAWEILLANVEAWANLAYQLHFEGILFDTEQYNTTLFAYLFQPDMTRSFEEYAVQVFELGQAVMQALNRGYPGLTVMFTYGRSIAAGLAPGDLPNFQYGLLIPFIDGMIAASTPQNTLIDGYERSYTYHSEAEFEAARGWFEWEIATFIAESTAYADHMQLGFGLWIDPRCDLLGLPSDCIFTPDQFYDAVQSAFVYSDKIVWIYSEQFNWYDSASVPLEWKVVMERLQ